MRFNEISTIDDYGLTLSAHGNNTYSSETKIFLDFNNLTENSFTNLSFSNPNQNKIEYNLESNQLKSLPKNIFENLMTESNSTSLFVVANQFKCDCDMKWIYEMQNLDKNRINSLLCINKNNTYLFKLNNTDFEKCT